MRTLARAGLAALCAAGMSLAFASGASATIHPIVESVDCANIIANTNHPLGAVADPIGQTPDVGEHSETSSLRAILVITDGFTDLSSPSLFGHKWNGTCGKVGQQ